MPDLNIFTNINAILSNKLDLSNILPNTPTKQDVALAESLDESSSHLQSLLGLSPVSSVSTNNVRTFQCGDLKYPDVSTPLRKILNCDSGLGSSLLNSDDETSPSKCSQDKDKETLDISSKNILASKDRPVTRSRSLSDSPQPAYTSPFVTRSHCSEAGSPTLEQALLMGSNGYGTSSGSSTTDYNLSELVDKINLNQPKYESLSPPTPPCNISQSPSSLFGAAALAKISGSQSSYRPRLPSISELDPAVTRAVRNQQSPQFISDGSVNLLSTLLGTGSYSPSFESPHQAFNLNSPSNDASVGVATLLPDRRPTSNSVLPTNPQDDTHPDEAAKLYRSGASLSDASCFWSGELPPRAHKNPVYSCKIFLGGVPWDVTEYSLVQAFRQFGPIRIEWPGKDNSPSPPKGYVYVIFEQEKTVKGLLSQCTHDYSNGGSWYYKISSRRMRAKEVQIIPWVVGDSNFVRCPSQRLDPRKTVFVGALHGMLNAEGLAHIFDNLFGGVVYAGIDTDKHKYPIGSGRVSFYNSRSYMKAVDAAFVELKTAKFTKKVQVDPYLEDALCSICALKQGPYFCRDLSCFKYFCRYCWELQHSVEVISHHKPLMRSNRAGGGPATRPLISLTPIHPAPVYDI